ncbi:MAG: YchF/TatD family DNA exonuclease [Candidatus Sabulitectum sp.]|nr:YchF/TatD family DNA exonuclease [Candidatus Sabulitectum sp.]
MSFMLGFDSHCHLHFNHFDEDLDAVVENSRKAGISHILIPSIDIETAEISADIAEKYNLYSAAAFHPEHLPEESAEEVEWLALKRVLLRPNTVAVGETGLDYHHCTFKPDKQRRWFRRHTELAEALGYPLVVHSRGAESAVLKELPTSLSVPVILHCWGGDESLTDIAVSRDFYIGVDGPLTYRKNNKLRRLIPRIPGDRLLVETDSPFLPPEPFRGRRNEPAYTRFITMGIRELWDGSMSIENTSYILWENAMRAYRLHPENRRADIVYRYGDSLYVNLTSRCQNNCSFCIRRSADGISSYYLKHKEDPAESLVLSTIEAFPIEDFTELVFCGFGEPTLRSDLLMKSARAAGARGVKTRLNTNGLCTSFLSDHQVMRLLHCFDSVSISLNASGTREYNRICLSSVEDSWEHLMKFIRLAKNTGIDTQLSVVKNSGVDLQRVKALAERLQMFLRIR